MQSRWPMMEVAVACSLAARKNRIRLLLLLLTMRPERKSRDRLICELYFYTLRTVRRVLAPLDECISIQLAGRTQLSASAVQSKAHTAECVNSFIRSLDHFGLAAATTSVLVRSGIEENSRAIEQPQRVNGNSDIKNLVTFVLAASRRFRQSFRC